MAPARLERFRASIAEADVWRMERPKIIAFVFEIVYRVVVVAVIVDGALGL